MPKFDFHKFLQLVGSIGPLVLLAVPGGAVIAPLVPVIIGAIGEAEQIKGATGAQKKAHVLNILDAAVVTANSTGKVNINSTAAQAAADKGIDAVISTIHVIEGAKIVKAPA
jgi:hypothetical protein